MIFFLIIIYHMHWTWLTFKIACFWGAFGGKKTTYPGIHAWRPEAKDLSAGEDPWKVQFIRNMTRKLILKFLNIPKMMCLGKCILAWFWIKTTETHYTSYFTKMRWWCRWRSSISPVKRRYELRSKQFGDSPGQLVIARFLNYQRRITCPGGLVPGFLKKSSTLANGNGTAQTEQTAVSSFLESGIDIANSRWMEGL